MPTLLRLLALPEILDALKMLDRDKHSSLVTVTKNKKVFIALAPGPNVIKLFTDVTYECSE